MKFGSLFSLVLVVTSSLVDGFCPSLVVAPTKKSSIITSSLMMSSTNDEIEISRRVALVMAAAMATTAGGTLPVAQAATLEKTVAKLEAENIEEVNTKGAPEKHLPNVNVNGNNVEIVVPHVMDPDKPHYIEYIWLKDETTNQIIAAKAFQATDASPPTLKATGVKKGSTLRALLFCNLHGLWEGETFSV